MVLLEVLANPNSIVTYDKYESRTLTQSCESQFVTKVFDHRKSSVAAAAIRERRRESV